MENNHQKFHFNVEMAKVGGDIIYLWHGTSNPDEVINDSVGFRINYAKDEGLYGRGLYFAQDASYSNNYGVVDKESKRGKLFLSKVLLGNILDQPIPTKFKSCPKDYHSVRGMSKNETIFILYDHSRAYPEYFVEYTF